eukprot:m.48116 g.48116  ORF g.48116 m.48116 type:complete len:112 (+) comp47664_c1_seq2:174-509(+)
MEVVTVVRNGAEEDEDVVRSKFDIVVGTVVRASAGAVVLAGTVVVDVVVVVVEVVTASVDVVDTSPPVVRRGADDEEAVVRSEAGTDVDVAVVRASAEAVVLEQWSCVPEQ